MRSDIIATMVQLMNRIKSITTRAYHVLKDDGPFGLTKRAGRYTYYRLYPHKRTKAAKDILFIDGCTLPHPSRYRVNHQMEQLEAAGLSVDSVFYNKLSLDQLKYYRGFIFFRCPITDTIKEFIETAKIFNKTCFFDIDDLVIDKRYTDTIPFVSKMNEPDKNLYDDGVSRMQETMRLCDYGITTTSQMKQELERYLPEVFISRNVASDEMVYRSNLAMDSIERDKQKVIIGYFSGSITHNDDIAMILPSLVKVMKRHSNVYIKLAGIIDIPLELEQFRDRIIFTEFMDWRDIITEVALCDIAISPLVDSIFNRAKSENKWTEASLVGVPIVASRVGAFAEQIEDGVTGILTENTTEGWSKAITRLVVDEDLRRSIGSSAREVVLSSRTTVVAAVPITEFIISRLNRNIGFVLPSTDISGGVNVVLKHADILRRRGWDVTIIDNIHKTSFNKSMKEYQYRTSIEGFNIIRTSSTDINQYFDTLVATLWSTLDFVRCYGNVQNRLYFVQNYETGFLDYGSGRPRSLANSTYYDQTGVRYVTMSLWCQQWLAETFGKESRYTSNGIDLATYPFRERSFDTSEKIKILVEGDSRSKYKNTDEAFRIINRLDSSRFDISYLSYRKEPKDWYRVDHYYNRIAPEKVGEIYASCDILIKTSLLESFSYPPLEMMATGGVSVVVPNDGNREYLVDGINCLFYEQGNIDDGVGAVMRLVEDADIRKLLIKNGYRTAKNYQWDKLEESVEAIYV